MIWGFFFVIILFIAVNFILFTTYRPERMNNILMPKKSYRGAGGCLKVICNPRVLNNLTKINIKTIAKRDKRENISKFPLTKEFLSIPRLVFPK